jgi:hypothetical protein
MVKGEKTAGRGEEINRIMALGLKWPFTCALSARKAKDRKDLFWDSLQKKTKKTKIGWTD